MAGPCWESPAPGLGKQQGCAGDGVSGRQQGQGDWVKREGHVAKPCLAPGGLEPLEPRTLHGCRSRGLGARAMLTPLLIQMYKDTSYSGERGPSTGQDARGGVQDARGGGARGRPSPV